MRVLSVCILCDDQGIHFKLNDRRDEGKINREERAILDERNGM